MQMITPYVNANHLAFDPGAKHSEPGPPRRGARGSRGNGSRWWERYGTPTRTKGPKSMKRVIQISSIVAILSTGFAARAQLVWEAMGGRAVSVAGGLAIGTNDTVFRFNRTCGSDPDCFALQSCVNGGP